MSIYIELGEFFRKITRPVQWEDIRKALKHYEEDQLQQAIYYLIEFYCVERRVYEVGKTFIVLYWSTSLFWDSTNTLAVSEARKQLQDTKTKLHGKLATEALDKFISLSEEVKAKRTRLQLAKESMEMLKLIQTEAPKLSLPELQVSLQSLTRQVNSLILEHDSMKSQLQCLFENSNPFVLNALVNYFPKKVLDKYVQIK